MSFFRHAIAIAIAIISAVGVARADTLQPLTRHDDPDDVVLGQADLLARLNRGRVYRLAQGESAPDGVASGDLLVTADVVLRDVRPGDAIVVRIGGNPAALASDPVQLRRVKSVDPCGADCRGRRAVVVATTGEQELQLRPGMLLGRLLYAIDPRTGGVREVHDPKLPRATSFAEAYNGWRPGWTAEAVGRRLEEMRRPARRELPAF